MGGLFILQKSLSSIFINVIRFQKESANTIIVTLTENSTMTNILYLFKFTSQQSNVDYYFIAQDTSGYLQRYNRFIVTEKASPNTLNGEVEVGDTGFYNYTAYETSLTTTTGLTTAQDAIPYIIKTVEVGNVWVVPTPQEYIEHEPEFNTSIVYTP